jgi:hypothetical protein
MSKVNISIWSNPRKLAISYSYKGSIVQALSRSNIVNRSNGIYLQLKGAVHFWLVILVNLLF